MVGYLAYSLSGHDKNHVYVIINEDKDYVWVVDGNLRTLDRPKKKNKKHIQIIKSHNCAEIMYNDKCDYVNDEIIKRAIKLYCKDIQEVE